MAAAVDRAGLRAQITPLVRDRLGSRPPIPAADVVEGILNALELGLAVVEPADNGYGIEVRFIRDAAPEAT